MMTYNYIEINPGIAGGSPVFKGTRIPLYTILDFISAGNTVEEILQHYPRLTEAHINEAVMKFKGTVINDASFTRR